jgi:hypothetical protein
VRRSVPLSSRVVFSFGAIRTVCVYILSAGQPFLLRIIVNTTDYFDSDCISVVQHTNPHFQQAGEPGALLSIFDSRSYYTYLDFAFTQDMQSESK